MSGRIIYFAALTVVGFTSTLTLVHAQEVPANDVPDPPVISTTASQAYPAVTCTSSDALAVSDTLQMASDTRDQLTTLLQLGPTWRFPVHIHLMTPDDPLTAKINREAAAFFSQGDTMKIEAVLPSSDPNAREFIQRQFVTALLWEKFFANTTSFDKHTKLDVVPLWLVEGLREWLNEDPEHNRESIVKRAVQNQSSPTLAEVTSWHELSDDRLLGLWQRAFCYYLVNSLTTEGPHRDDFQQWLAGFASPNPSAQLHFPTEVDWQRELVDASDRSDAIVYSWDETSAKVTAAETITYAASKDAKVQTCLIYEAATLPHSLPLFEALQERIYFLTELELRSHPSWNPILEMYRSGLTMLIKDNNIEQAKKLLQEAHKNTLAEIDYHQKLLDYINWFEVTKNYEEGPSQFNGYFTTAKEMERVQADPAHPNPIRTNLLQIESEL